MFFYNQDKRLINFDPVIPDMMWMLRKSVWRKQRLNAFINLPEVPQWKTKNKKINEPGITLFGGFIHITTLATIVGKSQGPHL